MRVMVAPMKVGHDSEASLRFAKSKRAKFTGFTEMDLGAHTALGLVRKVYGPWCRICTRNIGAHSQEIPVVVHKALPPRAKVRNFYLFPISANMPGGGVGNDRYLAEVWYEHRGRLWCLFMTHLDARIQNHDPKSPNYGNFEINDRWHVTQKAMALVSARISRAKRTADAIVFMADGNVLPVGQGLTDSSSPFVVLQRLGFKVLNERVTILAVWGTKIKSHYIFPRGQDGWGSDHGAIVADLARPSRKHGR